MCFSFRSILYPDCRQIYTKEKRCTRTSYQGTNTNDRVCAKKVKIQPKTKKSLCASSGYYGAVRPLIVFDYMPAKRRGLHEVLCVVSQDVLVLVLLVTHFARPELAPCMFHKRTVVFVHQQNQAPHCLAALVDLDPEDMVRGIQLGGSV